MREKELDLYSLGRNLNSDRVVERSSLQLGDLGGHGSREKVGVPLLRNDLENLIDDGSEIEVEESIGFVEDLEQTERKGTRRESALEIRCVSLSLSLSPLPSPFSAPAEVTLKGGRRTHQVLYVPQ